MIILILFICSLLVPSTARPHAQVHEWIGQYTMNRDGYVGTLSNHDSKQDCAATPWCHLVVRYTDSKGSVLPVKIDTIDQKFQHMVFHINFPNDTQKFDAYLFSWDKTKMDRITYWGGRTFGFFATK